jgi:hypothetical protein
LGAKHPKTKCSSLVLSLPCQTAMEGSGGVAHMRQHRLQGGAFTNTRRRRGLGAKNPKLSHCGSVSGLPCQTAVQGGGGWWWDGLYKATMVIGWRVCKPEVGRGWRSKTQNRVQQLGFGLHLGIERWRHVLWAHKTPFCGNLGGGGWAHLVTYDASCLSCFAQL